MFNDKAPITGKIKGNKDFIYFTTEVSSNLNKDFAHSQALEKPEQEGEAKRIEFLSSAFKMNHQIGSKDSIKWLKCLRDAQNHDIFLSNLKILVDYKWENVKWWVISDMIFHIVYAVLLGFDAIFFDSREVKFF